MALMKASGKGYEATLFTEQLPVIAKTDLDIQKIKKHFNFKLASFDGFNPNVKRSDMVPQPEDFYLFPFRLISAGIVGGGTWKATDFSNVKILRDSMSKLSNKPAYTNHQIFVGNEIGVIGETKWTDGFMAPDGTRVPPGVDGPYVIDSKLFPELVRKLNSPTSPIQSSSVTCVFDWEASHEFENENDFYYHLGEVVNGEMVRRIVTGINDYIESSLVYLGADPFAKKRDSAGNLINIDKAGIVSAVKYDKDPLYSLYKDQHRLLVWDCFEKEKTISLHQRIIIDPKTEDKKPMELINFLAGKLGIKPEEVTAEILAKYSFSKTDDFNKLKENADKVVALETDKVSLTKERDQFKKDLDTAVADKAKLEKPAAFGKVVMDAKKKECVDVYSKAMGGKPEQIVVDEINACEDASSLDAKMKFFGAKLMESFQPHCSKCGSNEVDFRSSAHEKGEGGDGNTKKDNSLVGHFRN